MLKPRHNNLNIYNQDANRLQEEREDRAYRENELRDRISDLERIVEQFGEYVAWCTAGHVPPPFAVSKKILDAAKRHRNKET